MIVIRYPDPICEILNRRDPDAYVSSLLESRLRDSIALPDGIDYSSLSSVIDRWTPWGKVRWIKSWFRRHESTFAAGTRLHFPLRSKYGCHMDDRGNVSFPWSTFLKRVSCVVKYVFHESAHLMLSRWDTYPALLALDKAFLSKWGYVDGVIGLSPVEYFATTLSVEMLSRAAEYLGDGMRAQRLLRQQEKEEAKLRSLLRTFSETINER